jgi:hypothetical protein
MHQLSIAAQQESYWYLARGGSLPDGMTTAALFTVIAVVCLTAAVLIKRKR